MLQKQALCFLQQIIKRLSGKKILWHLPWIAWVILVCVLSFLPGDRLPEVKWDFISIDTLAHLGMYSILAALLFTGFAIKNLNLSKVRLYLLLTLAAIAFGVMVELVQEFFIYKRHFSMKDIVANSFGTIFGILAMVFVTRNNSINGSGGK